MLRPFWVKRVRNRRRRLAASQAALRGESLESRIVLSASTAGAGHEHGPAGVDVAYGVFTPEEIEALEAIPFDSSLSSKPFAGPMPMADGGAHEADILTFVLDFKEVAQGMTSDVFGNMTTDFDVTAYGFMASDFNTVANAVLAEVEEDYFDELVGTVAGPVGSDLRVDFIIGDIGVAPAGITEYYYVQIGSVVAGSPHASSLGVAAGSSVRNNAGVGPNGVVAGDVVASIFTDNINGLGGLAPANALTSGNLTFTTMAISGTTSHEIGHTLSLSHIDKAGSTQPSPGAAPIMGTGAIDLPNQDRITDREFSLSGNDSQQGGAAVMHVQQLVDAVGLHSIAGNGPGTISGTKYDDLNGNGFRDPGEPGLAGWTIFVDENENGVFDFVDEVLEPDDFGNGQDVSTVDPNVTLTEVDNSNNPTGGIVSAFDVGAGSASTGTQTFVGNFTTWGAFIPARLRMDFNVEVTSVSIDAIGADVLGDVGQLEIYDAGDTLLDTYTTANLLAGTAETMTLNSVAPIAYAVAYAPLGFDTIYLDNLQYDAAEESTTTDGSGNYSFPNLPEGTYQLGEIQQAGWLQTSPQYGRLFAVADTTDEIVEFDPATGLEINRFGHPGAANPGNDGLAFNGTSLFLTDQTSLFELNPNDGTVLDTDTLASMGLGPGADIDGLAYLNGQLAALDFAGAQVIYIDPTVDLATQAVALDAAIDPDGGFTGAASRGTLFVTDQTANLIYEVNATTGAAINSFSSTSAGERGLAFVNGSLFLGDAVGNLIELNPDTGALIGTTPFIETWNALGGDGGLDGFWSVRVAGQTVTGVDFGNFELALPEATGLVVNAGSANRSGINTLTIQFDDPVTVNAPTSLTLFNHTTGMTVAVPWLPLVNNGTTAVTWTWDTTMFSLPDGRYSAELPATESTPNLAQTASFLFWKLTGDIDGDGFVNFNDTTPLTVNFGANTMVPYSDGDADGDGIVNFNDTAPLTLNFGASLAPLEFDFGDAPDPMFPTLAASGGAQHVVTGTTLTLGATRDSEGDGQPTADATGDGADEDGVVISGNGGDLETETAVAVDVTASAAGVLNGWIDYNQDGDWEDAGEQVFTDLAVAAGVNNLMITAPAGASVGSTIARFRLTNTAGYSYDGLAPDGEVEDYQITVNDNSDTAADLPSPSTDSADAFVDSSPSLLSLPIWSFDLFDADDDAVGLLGGL